MKRVLVVDDSKTILSSIKQEFSNYPDIEVVYVETYKEAVKVFRTYPKAIHAALLDINLPDAPNGEVISLANAHDVPTVVLTGSLNKEVRRNIEKKDIVAYILKNTRSSSELAVKFVRRILKNYETTVMVVDDSIVFRQILSLTLQSINIHVIEAGSGEEALDILENNKDQISMIITDYEMPGINGLDLTIKVRELYNKDQLSIIAISGAEDRDIIVDFLKFGANDFITKPFVSHEIVMRINSNLELLDIFSQLADMANKDYMTGSYNRRYFFESGKNILQKAQRKFTPIAVATLDIDNFKDVNDTYGHDIGDIAIKEIKRLLDINLRKSDLVARFGGEEYCILLEDISKKDLEALFEKIRLSFENNFIDIDGKKINYTVSFGVAFGMLDTLEEMINLSDEALYISKENGRNQVTIKSTD